MKCNYCGYNLEIEDVYCPHCGKKNEHVEKHAADMAKYDSEFKKTKAEVLSNSKRFNSITSRIAILCGMVALVAIMGLMVANKWEIRDWANDRKISKNAATYRQQIDKYEADRDYMRLAKYMQYHRIGYHKDFDEYYDLYEASEKYVSIYENVMRLNNIENEKYYSVSDICHSLGGYIIYLDEIVRVDRYDKENMHSEKHQAYMEDLKKDVQDLVQVYFELSDEEAAGIWTMKEARLSVLLEDRCEELGIEGDGYEGY